MERAKPPPDTLDLAHAISERHGPHEAALASLSHLTHTCLIRLESQTGLDLQPLRLLHGQMRCCYAKAQGLCPYRVDTAVAELNRAGTSAAAPDSTLRICPSPIDGSIPEGCPDEKCAATRRLVCMPQGKGH